MPPPTLNYEEPQKPARQLLLNGHWLPELLVPFSVVLRIISIDIALS